MPGVKKGRVQIKRKAMKRAAPLRRSAAPRRPVIRKPKALSSMKQLHQAHTHLKSATKTVNNFVDASGGKTKTEEQPASNERMDEAPDQYNYQDEYQEEPGTPVVKSSHNVAKSAPEEDYWFS